MTAEAKDIDSSFCLSSEKRQKKEGFSIEIHENTEDMSNGRLRE